MHGLKDPLPVVGKTELRYTPNTGCPRQAKRKTKKIYRKVKGLFEELREGKHGVADSKLTNCFLIVMTWD